MRVQTGLDVLARSGFESLLRKRVGLVCNQATLTQGFDHAIDIMRRAGVQLGAIFGPQHGLFGHTQDNMIEWEGKSDPGASTPIYSLYGEHREPTQSQLSGLDQLVIDLPDIGARYYTFIWTTALCMKACEAARLPITILDRPNPLGGQRVEGTVQAPGFESFVGLHPLPMRHGMTLGEIGLYMRDSFYPKVALNVVKAEGWSRSDSWPALERAWIMPSPNMPTFDTALTYPGMCLLEGTNLSEGRGTTRPFEIFGAPFIDGDALTSGLNGLGLKGVHFRRIEFQPTFQKHAGEICQGAFIHVTDKETYGPVLTAVAILHACRTQGGEKFHWNPPPYEYEYEKLPIDILAGNEWLRSAIDGPSPLAEIEERMASETAAFSAKREYCFLYDEPPGNMHG